MAAPVAAADVFALTVQQVEARLDLATTARSALQVDYARAITQADAEVAFWKRAVGWARQDELAVEHGVDTGRCPPTQCKACWRRGRGVNQAP